MEIQIQALPILFLSYSGSFRLRLSNDHDEGRRWPRDDISLDSIPRPRVKTEMRMSMSNANRRESKLPLLFRLEDDPVSLACLVRLADYEHTSECSRK